MGDRIRRLLRRREVRLVPAALLIVVAVITITRVEVIDASTYRGAGFTMFARADHVGTRYPRVIEHRGEAAVSVTWPADLAGDLNRVLVVPSQANVDRAAARLLAGSDADRIVVEIWGIEVDGDTVRPTMKVTAEAGR